MTLTPLTFNGEAGEVGPYSYTQSPMKITNTNTKKIQTQENTRSNTNKRHIQIQIRKIIQMRMQIQKTQGGYSPPSGLLRKPWHSHDRAECRGSRGHKNKSR